MRIGTRASTLAKLQTQIVVSNLEALFPHEIIEVVHVTTGGDKQTDKPIADLGFRGVFVKELEDALLRHEVDLVVHSMKDVPTDIPPGLALAAVLQREDPRDVMVGKRLEELRQGAAVATSSRRRSAQLKEIRPDLNFIDIRGNIETRLRKLDEGHCDATLLAHAGLLRLGLAGRVSQIFDVEQLTPAAGQGALAVECRVNDELVFDKLVQIDDRRVRGEVECERAFLAELGGGCSVPIGAVAITDGSELTLIGCIASLDGNRIFRAKKTDSARRTQAIGRELAETMMQNGARPVIEELRASLPNRISPP